MRMQEGPSRKRVRSQPTPVDDASESSEGSSAEEHTGSDSAAEEELDDEGDEDSATSDSDDNEAANLGAADVQDRFTSSRLGVTPRAGTVQTTSATAAASSPTSWTSMGIIAPLQAALASMSIKTPTEIQASCIPPLMAGK